MKANTKKGQTPAFQMLVGRAGAVACALWLYGCAAVNPNPNTGMRSVDELARSGNCAEAIRVAEPHANNGEPWAQYRMGMLKINERCPPYDWDGAVVWLEKAASFRSKTPWERGSDLSTGPNGFFNGRASATNASQSLVEIYRRRRDWISAWYWVDHAAGEYEEGDATRKRIEQLKKDLEAHMSSDDLAKARARRDEAMKTSR